jgi:hypothetical protein
MGQGIMDALPMSRVACDTLEDRPNSVMQAARLNIPMY